MVESNRRRCSTTPRCSVRPSTGCAGSATSVRSAWSAKPEEVIAGNRQRRRRGSSATIGPGFRSGDFRADRDRGIHRGDAARTRPAPGDAASPRRVAVQAHIDLHGMIQADAKLALEEFIVGSVRKGLRTVLVVHGRGLRSPGGMPVLKHAAAQWLSHGHMGGYVLAFATARPADGGAGAMYVLLQRESPSRPLRRPARRQTPRLSGALHRVNFWLTAGDPTLPLPAGGRAQKLRTGWHGATFSRACGPLPRPADDAPTRKYAYCLRSRLRSACAHESSNPRRSARNGSCNSRTSAWSLPPVSFGR